MTSFFTSLQVLPTQLHRFNLQTKSYHDYEILKDLQKESFHLVDTIIKNYQALDGDIIIYDQLVNLDNLSRVDLIPFLNEIYYDISKVQDQIKYSDIVNLLDQLKSSITQTKYKLTFLK